MTELYYPPKTQDTYNDSQQIIESYEKELAEDGKTKAERDRKKLLRCQNAELFEIENKFDNPDEWTRIRAEGFAIHIKDKPKGGEIMPDDLQVWMWEDSEKGWFWQGKEFIEEENKEKRPEPEPEPGTFQFTTRLLLDSGRKLTVCWANKFTKEDGITQEFRGVYDGSGKKLEPVAIPDIRLDDDSQDRLSSPVKNMPPELSPEEIEGRRVKRLVNQERARQVRSKHGLGTTAVGNRARII